MGAIFYKNIPKHGSVFQNYEKWDHILGRIGTFLPWKWNDPWKWIGIFRLEWHTPHSNPNSTTLAKDSSKIHIWVPNEDHCLVCFHIFQNWYESPTKNGRWARFGQLVACSPAKWLCHTVVTGSHCCCYAPVLHQFCVVIGTIEVQGRQSVIR